MQPESETLIFESIPIFQTPPVETEFQEPGLQTEHGVHELPPIESHPESATPYYQPPA